MKRNEYNDKKTINSRKECEQIWARNKYLVLSKSQNLYKEIREYLKGDMVEISYLNAKIDIARKMEEDRGECANAFHHVWGYFKKEASTEEQNTFLELIEDYLKYEKNQSDLVEYIKSLLEKYPNEYIKNSTLIESDCDETLA